ncbi:hypothetical protein RI129_007872 [Pyrocoelia pectoralis]|uniref:Cytochrome P450 n=1 Tax=Pyrocoelia pectoralis TaxID=417401 RepID=A0AAN7ZHE1_9COLE
MWVLIFTTIVVLIIFRLKKVYSYWKDRGVDYVSPLRSFGPFAENILRMNSHSEVLKRIYDEFPNKRYVGFYNIFQPVLIIRDLELVKRICVKDYHVFHSHSEIIPSELDDLWSKHLFNLTDKKLWNNLRTPLRQFFTTNKLKLSFPVIQKVSRNLINYLKTKSKGQPYTLETREIFKRLLNDISANAYFGVNCDAINNGENEFMYMARKAMSISMMSGVKHVIANLFPRLLKSMGAKIYSKEVRTFFTSIIKQSIKMRYENEFRGPDVINTLLQLYDADKSHLDNLSESTVKNITAQAIILYFAGFETTTSTLSMLVYEITLNPDIQTKLYEEIVNTLKGFNGTVSYDAIMAMEYLDNVVKETLRLHTPTSLLDRRAMSDYEIESEDPKEKTLLVKKGTPVWILQKAIHLDPNNFPNPEKFDPDRFSYGNKQNIKNYSHIPFGSGPRSCLGYRHAMVVVKLTITELLLNYELLPTNKTYVKNSSKTYNIIDHGVWVKLNPRMK